LSIWMLNKLLLIQWQVDSMSPHKCLISQSLV
jgi:hypothetical protein